MSESHPLPSKDVLRNIVDVHCHPTDSEISDEHMNDLDITICAMATRDDDQDVVAELARSYPTKVIPCFGYHPWFTHWMSTAEGSPPQKEQHYRAVFHEQLKSEQLAEDFETLMKSLPEPISLKYCLTKLQQNLTEFPHAMVGEVGIDRSARVPFDHRQEKRELSKFLVPIEHQMHVLEAQLRVAVQLRRNVSLHSVKSPSQTAALLDRMAQEHGAAWGQINVDLHSCGLSPEMWKSIERKHQNIYLSLSTAINGRSPNHIALIKVCEPRRLLVESDIHQVWQTTARAWDMINIIAEVRGWRLETEWLEDQSEDSTGVVHSIATNWKSFARDCHLPRATNHK